MYCFSYQTFHIRTYAKIKCHATFKSSGKPDSAEAELKDIDKKYEKKENIGDGLVGVKDKVGFTWIDNGRIFFPLRQRMK